MVIFVSSKIKQFAVFALLVRLPKVKFVVDAPVVLSALFITSIHAPFAKENCLMSTKFIKLKITNGCNKLTKKFKGKN